MAEQTAGLMPGADVELGPAERRLLAGMPLHAITSVHGEAGLRERLFRGGHRNGVGGGRPIRARPRSNPQAAFDQWLAARLAAPPAPSAAVTGRYLSLRPGSPAA